MLPSNFVLKDKTPLHRARTKRMVEILLDNGADPYAKMMPRCIKPNEKGTIKSKSAFEVLLHRNPEAAELILNKSIQKYNDLDSPELVIVYDFEMFLRECESSTRENDQAFNEMAVHSKVSNILTFQIMRDLSYHCFHGLNVKIDILREKQLGKL